MTGKKIILIVESGEYSTAALSLYSKLGKIYFYERLKERDLKKVLPKINILIVRLGHKIDKNWLDKLPNLELIASPTTGLNHIDLAEAKKRKIVVISLKGRTSFLKNITSTAEETLALLLSLVRNIPWAFDDVKRGVWNRNAWKGHQLIGKTLGILGYGRLGKIMARYGKMLGMKVIICDPNLKKKIKNIVGMEKLFKQSDILSVHVNLEKDTENLVSGRYLKMMKPSAYLINTSRGEILDESALLSALKNKWIAGAALDVMKDEVGGRHLKNNPLLDYAKKNKNLIIVPHIGGATHEAMHITEEYVANLVLDYY
ncbi:hypothetical protein HZB05_01925 [Candidatus Wolfebacteria bacterium]|nr:hypothetical protein [Candidatus Wolfebacteria bacterium]